MLNRVVVVQHVAEESPYRIMELQEVKLPGILGI